MSRYRLSEQGIHRFRRSHRFALDNHTASNSEFVGADFQIDLVIARSNAGGVYDEAIPSFTVSMPHTL